MTPQVTPPDDFVLDHLLRSYKHAAEAIYEKFGIQDAWVRMLPIHDAREYVWYFDFPGTLMLNPDGAPHMGRELPLASKKFTQTSIFIIRGHHAFLCENLLPGKGYTLFIVNDDNVCSEKPQGW